MDSTGAGPRLVISPGDHEALVVLTAVVCLTWTLLVLIVRLYLRLRLNGPFGYDDWAALVATAIAVVQTSVTLAAVHDGVGEKSDLLSPSQIGKALKCLYAASILYVASICAAKCSMWQLIARLTRTESHTIATHALTGFTIGWGVTALFVVAMQCELPSPWNTTTQQNCPNLFLSWAAIEAFSLFIELLVCAVSIWLVWSLQMSRGLKVVVVGLFLMRLLIIIPTVFKIILLRNNLPSSDTTFNSTGVVIATQVTMHYTVMAATLPCMRTFLQAFNSGLGATTGMITADGYDSDAYAKGSKGSRFGNSKIKTSIALQSVDTDVEKMMMAKAATFRPDHGHTTTTTITSAGDQYHAERERKLQGRQNRSTSRGSWDSDEWKLPIIKKTLEWEIRRETRDVEGMFSF